MLKNNDLEGNIPDPDVQLYIIGPELPWPENSGERRRMNALASNFAKRFSMHFIAPRVEAEALDLAGFQDRVGAPVLTFPWKFPSKRAAAAETLFRLRPYHTNLFHTDWIQELRRMGIFQDDAVVYCNFIYLAEHFKGYKGCLVVDQHNYDSDHWESYAARNRNPFKRIFSRLNRQLVLRQERAVYPLADLVVTTAERDSNFIQRDFPGTKIVLGPNGADTEYFSPMLHIEPEKSSLVFFGALQVQMNEDGVLFFLDEIFPLIKLKVEDAQLKIVGKNPSRALTMRHSPPSIDVLGEVPDVRVPVAQSSVVVVPNLYGGGTKLKTIEAMSMGKAVVSTSTGVQGLGVRDGIEVLIADDPIEFAGKTTRALLDKDLAFQLGLNARQFVKDNFDWRSISAGIIKELEIRIPDNPANGG